LARFRQPLLHVDIAVETLPDVRAQVPELIDEGNKSPIGGNGNVAQVGAVGWLARAREEHAFGL
jgi:hypothetical protein